MADTWDETRIAELRRLAERRMETEKAVTMECAALPHRGGWSAPLDDAISADNRARLALLPFLNGDGLLSLLDELESVRRERDELVRAVEKHAEAMAIECMLGVGEWDSCVPSHLRESFFAAYRSIHPEWQ